MASGPLRGRVVCATGLEAAARNALRARVESLGGVFSAALVRDASVLIVARALGSEKYMRAVEAGIAVVRPGFVDAISRRAALGPVDDEAFRALCADQRLPVFAGCRVCVTGVSSVAERTALGELIEAHGGEYARELCAAATHLVSGTPIGAPPSAKTLFARRAGIRVASVAWVHDCVTQNMLIDIPVPEDEHDPLAVDVFGMSRPSQSYDYGDLCAEDVARVAHDDHSFPQYFAGLHFYVAGSADASSLAVSAIAEEPAPKRARRCDSLSPELSSGGGSSPSTPCDASETLSPCELAERLALLRRLILVAGGVRHADLAPERAALITHYVVHGQTLRVPEGRELALLSSQAAAAGRSPPLVVHDQWLVACFHARSLVDSTAFEVGIAYDLASQLSLGEPSPSQTLSDTSSVVPRVSSSRGIAIPHSQTRSQSVRQVRDAILNKRPVTLLRDTNRDTRSASSTQTSQPSAPFAFGRLMLALHAELRAHSVSAALLTDSLERLGATVVSATGLDPRAISDSSCVVPMSGPHRSQSPLEDELGNGAHIGSLGAASRWGAHADPQVDYVICPVVMRSPMPASVHARSKRWADRCIRERRVLADGETPLPLVMGGDAPDRPLAGLSFSVTGILNDERGFYTEVLQALGAEVFEELNAEKSHLLAADAAAASPKMEYARQRGIHVVSLAALVDAVRRGDFSAIPPRRESRSDGVYGNRAAPNGSVAGVTFAQPRPPRRPRAVPRPPLALTPDAGDHLGTGGLVGADVHRPETGGVLAGCVVAISPKMWHKRDALHAMATSLGASFAWAYDRACTHYIHSSSRAEETFHELERVIRHGTACVVSPAWLQECSSRSLRADEALFPGLIAPQPRNAVAEAVRTSPPSMSPPSVVQVDSECPASNWDDAIARDRALARTRTTAIGYDMRTRRDPPPAEPAQRPLVFMLSGLEPDVRVAFAEALELVVRETGATVRVLPTTPVDGWDPATTHLVTGSLVLNEKLLAACAAGGVAVLRPSYVSYVLEASEDGTPPAASVVASRLASPGADLLHEWDPTLPGLPEDQRRHAATARRWRASTTPAFSAWRVLLVCDPKRVHAMATVLAAGGASVVVAGSKDEDRVTHRRRVRWLDPAHLAAAAGCSSASEGASGDAPVTPRSGAVGPVVGPSVLSGLTHVLLSTPTLRSVLPSRVRKLFREDMYHPIDVIIRHMHGG